MAYLVGQTVRLTFRTYSDPAATTPADPTAITAGVQNPDGTQAAHTWPAGDITRSALGVFTLDLTPAAAGHYDVYWAATGAVTTADEQVFDVRAPRTSPISIDVVKARLNKTLSITVDDDELEEMLEAAEAEYVEWIGPLTGTVTETFDGGGTTIVLRQAVNAVTGASYSSGQALAYTDLVVANGIVRWKYGTAGRFTAGARVSITYAVPAAPANHLETIIADVAGYFEATQRSTGAGQADFPGEGEYESAYTATPQILFPRIRALAAAYPSVG